MVDASPKMFESHQLFSHSNPLSGVPPNLLLLYIRTSLKSLTSLECPTIWEEFLPPFFYFIYLFIYLRRGNYLFPPLTFPVQQECIATPPILLMVQLFCAAFVTPTMPVLTLSEPICAHWSQHKLTPWPNWPAADLARNNNKSTHREQKGHSQEQESTIVLGDWDQLMENWQPKVFHLNWPRISSNTKILTPLFSSNPELNWSIEY